MSATARRPLRVVVVDHTAELGGAELALVRLCAALRDRPGGPRVRVRVLLGADGPLRPLLEREGVGVDVVPLAASLGGVRRADALRPGADPLRRLGAAVAFTVRLAWRLRALRPDVVHATSLKADLLTLLPAALARRPLVWHVHDRIAPDYLPAAAVRLVRAASRLPAAVVANSRATAATLPGPCTVAYPGLAPAQLRARRAGAPGPGAAPVVGVVGRLSPTKGQRELLRALPAVLRAHPRARLRVVGEASFGAGAYERALRDEARRLGVAHAVDWVGFVPDPAAELDAFAVCVHASPVPEPFGQVVVEAMARGVPVVATRAGGVPEILDPEGPAGGDGAGPLGRLVAPGDVGALARAVLEVLDRPAEAAARAARAADAARARFPVARTAEAVSEVWWRVAARGPAPRP